MLTDWKVTSIQTIAQDYHYYDPDQTPMQWETGEYHEMVNTLDQMRQRNDFIRLGKYNLVWFKAVQTQWVNEQWYFKIIEDSIKSKKYNKRKLILKKKQFKKKWKYDNIKTKQKEEICKAYVDNIVYCLYYVCMYV